ncbi:unnamed protein product [Cuscuta europaea]|uniref:Uncharacterized protein n=1 Tax=Cuscuta europaea TaxID=41803 RepID=A0A9P0ZXG7_CUSEU|nr:unnamed protein product [Cuscuta europaea]
MEGGTSSVGGAESENSTKNDPAWKHNYLVNKKDPKSALMHLVQYDVTYIVFGPPPTQEQMVDVVMMARREAKAVKKRATAARARGGTQSFEANSSAASQGDKRVGEAEQQLIAAVTGQGSEVPNVEAGSVLDVEPVGVAPPADREKARGKKPKRQRTEPSGPKAPDAALPSLGCLAPEVWRDMAFELGWSYQPVRRLRLLPVGQAMAQILAVGWSLLQAEAAQE